MHTIMKEFIFLVILSIMVACTGQNKVEDKNVAIPHKGLVGGPFENGEFMYIGMPEKINAVDTSAAWNLNGQKLLITGTIFKKDGRTPAPGVILYYYHTDTNGLYAYKKGLDERVRRHGYIRGWIKSDENGKYAIYTVRPAAYPNSNEPAHIHPSIKEPLIEKEYYIDEFVFDDDKLLTSAKRRAMENRGGSGILRVLRQGDLQIAEHNIILGLHIPNYPETEKNTVVSGKEIGEDVLSFTPIHAWGPDKGTKTCPICKYGRYHGILYFVGNHPDWSQIKKWLVYFESESTARKHYLKTYLIYGNEQDYESSERMKQLEALGAELRLQHVALTFVPSFSDTASEINLNQINPAVGNTILLYRNSTIIDKFLDLEANKANFELITKRLNETTNNYFNLPTPSGVE
ncbi:MAG: intradiol ring-cleavage dioxygenase [Maribacter sp.]|nr:intradiol ring-cleavage dioxygenase [Maribacter sp.]